CEDHHCREKPEIAGHGADIVLGVVVGAHEIEMGDTMIMWDSIGSHIRCRSWRLCRRRSENEFGRTPGRTRATGGSWYWRVCCWQLYPGSLPFFLTNTTCRSSFSTCCICWRW